MTENATRLTGVKLDAVTLSRGARRLVADVQLSLCAGELVCVTGANGVGKTSLIRAIAGLLRPDSGAISFFSGADALDAESVRTKHIHLLAHQDGLKSARMVRQELAFWSHWLDGGDGIDSAAEALSLTALLDLDVRKLSAGQRRRLALARLIAAPRPLWLLDEPMAPLDTSARQRLADIMYRHLQDGGMILAAVHDALPLAGKTLHLEQAP
jgi:heme exporter protein A